MDNVYILTTSRKIENNQTFALIQIVPQPCLLETVHVHKLHGENSKNANRIHHNSIDITENVPIFK